MVEKQELLKVIIKMTVSELIENLKDISCPNATVYFEEIYGLDGAQNITGILWNSEEVRLTNENND